MKTPQFDPAWSTEVAEIYRNDMREIWDRDIERHSFNCYQNQLKFYLDLVNDLNPATVLDVGCAQGTLALLLGESGRTVTGVDIRPAFLEYAKSRYERGDVTFVAANIFDEPPLGRFELVFANQIIEHVVYPVQLLQTLKQYVAPGGSLVVTTPNHDYIRSPLPSYTELGDPKMHEHRQFSAGGGDHFFAYTEEELRAAADKAELHVLEVHYFESPMISGHAKVRHLHRALPVPVLAFLDHLVLRVIPRKAAHQLCVVLRGEP